MEKIGQMFIVAYEDNVITSELENLIKNYKIGGIILYRKSFMKYTDLVNFINKLKDLNKDNPYPLFISIDQEGGRVNRLPKEIKRLAAPFHLTKKKDISIVEKSTRITSKILKETGYNMNFAPVLDIKNFGDSHSIGDRCYGDNVDDVSKYGICAMKEFQKNGVIPVIKHFPGHGATKIDSHFLLPIITKKREFLEKEDMKCFKNAIENGADALMVGHLLVTSIDNLYPASLSKKFIKTILRNDFKYNGVIITDSFKMLAIKLLYGEKRAVKRAIMAGNDMIMLKYSIKKEMQCINYVKELVLKGKLSSKDIDNSVNRIIALKTKYGLLDTPVYGIDIDNANTIIEEINSSINN